MTEATTFSVRDGMFNPPVYRAGSGEPLLFFHGAGGNAGLTPDLLELSKSYDVIAPVHPGFNDTEGLEKIDDIHDLVVYYQDFADALGLKTFNLMGHSLGGMFAAEFAAARPDMVKKLVLVDPIGLWMDETPVADFFAVLPNELPQLLFGDPTNPLIAQMMPPPADMDELADRMYLQLANFSATGKFVWPIPDKGLKKRLHRISAPTLILWGEMDRLVPSAYGDLFHTKIKNSQLVKIPGAGHMVMLEAMEPAVREIQGFLG